MTKFLIVALFCAPGWLLGGTVRYHAPARHPTPTARATNTPAPTTTPMPTNTPVPTNTPIPTATASPTVTPDCWADYDRCLLSLINEKRSAKGYAPLALSAQQTPRSQSHANAMAASGSIWHVSPTDPADSFPATIYCYPFCAAGENVGEASGAEEAALQADLDQMLSEPWSPGCVGSHSCNILSASYHSIGIGITYSSGAVWVVQDFIS